MYAGSQHEQALIKAISDLSSVVGYMEGIKVPQLEGRTLGTVNANPLTSRELSLAITYSEDGLLRLQQLHGRLRGED